MRPTLQCGGTRERVSPELAWLEERLSGVVARAASPRDQDGERERVKTHWKMSLQMSSLREDELEALEPRREPKLGRATDERLRMAGGGVGGGVCAGAESQ